MKLEHLADVADALGEVLDAVGHHAAAWIVRRDNPNETALTAIVREVEPDASLPSDQRELFLRALREWGAHRYHAARATLRELDALRGGSQ